MWRNRTSIRYTIATDYMNFAPLRYLSFLVLLASSLVLSDCATNPVTGKRQLSLISEESEIQMGQQYDPQVVAEMGIYKDAALEQFLSEKGKAMAAISERPNLPWTFRLVDTDVVNAFAVPGGFVYFTRGIMAHFNNEAQFAGVLGHEIGHVTARHTVAQQSRQQLGQIGLIGGMILSPELANQGETLMQGMQLLFLKYGRDAESQSDGLGVKYSTEIGYDSKEMAGFFNTLDKLSGGAENRAPSFLSTHPDPLNREAEVLKLTEAAQAANPRTEYEVDRDSYLRRIDGLLYGEDPNQGFVDGNSFYHPSLKFQFGIPNGWRLQNAPTQVQIVSPDQQSVIQMSLAEGTDARAAAQAFAEQNKVQVASSSDRAINGLPATTIVGQITTAAAEGQAAQSIAVMISFISYGGNVYMLAGITPAAKFKQYSSAIEGTLGSFAQLTDQSKLNRKPERIKIITTPRAMTLRQGLLDNGIPESRLNEFAILNGMDINTELPAGYLFKALSGGAGDIRP